MTKVQTLERQALGLNEAERAALAASLLDTLPAVLFDADDGVAEARRRDAEMEANPAVGVEWSALKKELGR